MFTQGGSSYGVGRFNIDGIDAAFSGAGRGYDHGIDWTTDTLPEGTLMRVVTLRFTYGVCMRWGVHGYLPSTGKKIAHIILEVFTPIFHPRFKSLDLVRIQRSLGVGWVLE